MPTSQWTIAAYVKCISTPITLITTKMLLFNLCVDWVVNYGNLKNKGIRPVRYLSQNWSLTRAFFFQTVSQFKLDFHRLSGYIYKCKLVEIISFSAKHNIIHVSFWWHHAFASVNCESMVNVLCVITLVPHTLWIPHC